MKTERTKLYALIVGIDDYPRCPLNGCVRDAQSIETFLNSELITAHYDSDIIHLHNGEAKKDTIAKTFVSHLGQAGENDVAFFFFAGHGAQENADDQLWHEEPDGKLEGLVCHDSLDRKLLLADKELRYIIHQVAQKKPHLVTIFDCCHSGENTRGPADEEKLTKRQFADSRMGSVFPQREWKNFFFHGLRRNDPSSLMDLRSGYLLRINSTVNAL